MKTKFLLKILIAELIFPLFVSAQNSPKIVFTGKKTLIAYRKTTSHRVRLNIAYTKKDLDSAIYHVALIVSQTSGKPGQDTLSASKFIFGVNYPTSYDVNVALSTDTSDHTPYLIEIVAKLDGTTQMLDTCHIFYQPDSAVATPIETKLLKSNDEVKADLNSLKSQILKGDTTTTYIGTLIIKPSAFAVSAGSADIPSKTVLDKVKNDPDVKPTIGTPEVTLKKTIPARKRHVAKEVIYKLTPKTIDSAVVTIVEGEIEYLKITMTDGTYYVNLNAPIPILNIEGSFQDKLVCPVDSSYIFVKSALNFVVNQRFNYFPSDGTYTLNNNSLHPKKQQKVYANNGLVSFVDFRVFTDLFGALDNQPNGLVQIEAKSKIYLHRQSIPNHFMYFFYGLEPYLGVSKFDSKFDTVKVTSITGPINRMDLFQRSFFNVGVKVNVFRWDFRPSNTFYLNYGFQLNASNVTYINNGTTKSDSITGKGLFNTQYLEMGLTSKRLNNFGFDGSAKLLFQQLNQNKLFTNSGYNRLLDFNVTAFYYVGVKPNNCFFVRFSDYLNYSDRKDDFYQLQFGYSLNLRLQK